MTVSFLKKEEKVAKKQSEKEQFQERKQDRACESVHVDQPQK